MKIILTDESVIECQAAELDTDMLFTDNGLMIPIDTVKGFET